VLGESVVAGFEIVAGVDLVDTVADFGNGLDTMMSTVGTAELRLVVAHWRDWSRFVAVVTGSKDSTDFVRAETAAAFVTAAVGFPGLPADTQTVVLILVVGNSLDTEADIEIEKAFLVAVAVVGGKVGLDAASTCWMNVADSAPGSR